MAGVIITPVYGSPPGNTRRGEKVRAVKIMADASKPAGGYPIAATRFNMSTIDQVLVQTPDPLYHVAWLSATDQASGSLQWYKDTTGGTSLSALHVAAAASDTKVSLSSVAMIVFGR